VNARIVAPIALLALAVPAPAFAADAGSGGTGIPSGANGGVQSIPGHPATPPGPASADAGPATEPPAVGDAPGKTPRATIRPVAHAAKSGDGDVVDVPVPRGKRKAAAAVPSTQAAPTASLPMTGFDLGLFASVGLLMTGVGLLLSAAVGPAPSRRRA
jgi:hypothetical protein